jgi:hypothetical protein
MKQKVIDTIGSDRWVRLQVQAEHTLRQGRSALDKRLQTACTVAAGKHPDNEEAAVAFAVIRTLAAANSSSTPEDKQRYQDALDNAPQSKPKPKGSGDSQEQPSAKTSELEKKKTRRHPEGETPEEAK